jgi:hypothetical protein
MKLTDATKRQMLRQFVRWARKLQLQASIETLLQNGSKAVLLELIRNDSKRNAAYFASPFMVNTLITQADLYLRVLEASRAQTLLVKLTLWTPDVREAIFYLSPYSRVNLGEMHRRELATAA